MNYLLPFLLVLCAAPSAAFPAESFTRIGIVLGGTGAISFCVERHYGDTFARITAGILEPQEICLSASVNHSFSGRDISPHAGIGIMNVLIFPKGKAGGLGFINLLAGIDGKLTDRNAMGVEGDLNIFLGGRQPGGGKATFGDGSFRKRLLPLPAVYYQYRL